MNGHGWLDLSYEEALRDIALRAVASRMVGGITKLALLDDSAREEAINQAQSARQELGVLGANEKTINQALEGLRSGKKSPFSARMAIRGAVPGIHKQVGQIPQAAGTAFAQGDWGDTLNQLDVPGFKNVNPLSSYWSPTTTGLGLAANVAARKMPHQALGRLEDYVREGPVAEGLPRSVQEWLKGRHEGRLKKFVETGDLTRDPLKHRFTPKQQADLARGVKDPEKLLKGRLGRQIGKAYHHQRYTPPPAGEGKGGFLKGVTGGWGPSLAFMAPAVLREWLGGGYRSGRQPAYNLVEANRILSGK